MVIKRNSWHYKFNAFCYEVWRLSDMMHPDCNTLCGYFLLTCWNLIFFVGMMLVLAYLVLVCFFIIITVGYLLPAPILYPLGIGEYNYDIAIVMGYSEIVLLSCVLYKIRKNQPPSSNILIEYLKAKKQKVCPIITFED